MKSQISEQDSLKIITEMLEKARFKVSSGSIFYLIWGWAVLLAAVGQYLMIEVFEYTNHWILWPILMFGSGIISIIVGRSHSKNVKYVTFADHTFKYLWSGFIIYLFIILFMSSQIGWQYSYVLVVGLYGLATFISGGVLRFKPLIYGGALSLALAIFAIFGNSLFNEFSDILVLLIISIVVSYLIPGYMLRAQKDTYAART